MKDNEIIVIHGTDYKEMTKKLLGAAGLMERVKAKGGKDIKIGIKPNLVSSSAPSNGATTHTEILAGIIEFLQERGYNNLMLLEGSWVGDRTDRVMKICGYDKLVKKYGVPFYDLQKDSWESRDCAGMKIDICEKVKELGFLINVPVLKGHCQTKVTCALKNMKGLIPNKEKRRFHTMGLHKPIAHLNTRIKQDFIVVDNICGDWDFEDGGNPVRMDRILAAVDPVLCDAYVCDLMGYKVDDVPYVRMAEKLGVGSADLSRMEIRALNEASADFAAPETRKIVELADAVEEIDSCSACYGYLIPALSRLKEEGLLDRLNEKICIGQGYRGKTGILGIGNCTRGFEHSLKGCPPTEGEIYEFLKSIL